MSSNNNFGNMDIYNRFKDLVYLNYEKFSYEEKFNFLTNLKAFLGISEKKVKVNLKEEKYEILNKMIEENMYGHTQDSKIYHSTFVNIVLMLLDQKKIKEAEEFIKKFSGKLEEQVRENVLNEAYAWLNFHKKNFKESLKYVIKINDEMFNLKYRSRLLEIMCLYELKEYDQLEYSIKAAQKYLNENKSVSKAFHDRLYEFTGILQQLAVHELDGKKDFIPDKIMNSIKENQFLFMKEWILQKLKEKGTLT
jgi:predicted nucleic-acid-binding protein